MNSLLTIFISSLLTTHYGASSPSPFHDATLHMLVRFRGRLSAEDSSPTEMCVGV